MNLIDSHYIIINDEYEEFGEMGIDWHVLIQRETEADLETNQNDNYGNENNNK